MLQSYTTIDLFLESIPINLRFVIDFNEMRLTGVYFGLTWSKFNIMIIVEHLNIRGFFI